MVIEEILLGGEGRKMESNKKFTTAYVSDLLQVLWCSKRKRQWEFQKAVPNVVSQAWCFTQLFLRSIFTFANVWCRHSMFL